MRQTDERNRQNGVGPVAGIFETQEIEQRLGLLREEHRDLDMAISALLESPNADQLQVARMKRRKLRIKDEIQLLESQLVPDIIA
jgi:hypothetical protein